MIAAGGTAGHVVPALAVADALRAEGATVSLPREWYIHTLFTYGSGKPFNITSGVDANGNGPTKDSAT